MVENIVITFDGTKASRKDCRFIKGQYYIKNKQCFYLRDKWIRINSKFLIKDHELNVYTHIEDASSLYKGIIGFDEDGKYVIGHYSPNPLKNCFIYDEVGSKIGCINHSIINTNIYIETNKGFIHKNYASTLSSNNPLLNNTLRDYRMSYNSFRLEYNTDHVMSVYMNIYNKNNGYKSFISEMSLKHSYGKRKKLI